LHANLVQAAWSRAADALTDVIERWKDGEYADLHRDFAEYDNRSATFHDDHASLSAVDGRVNVKYILLPDTVPSKQLTGST
jgi:putative transposase